MNDSQSTKNGSVVREPVPAPLYLFPAAAREDAMQAQIRVLNQALELIYEALFTPAGRARKDGLS